MNTEPDGSCCGPGYASPAEAMRRLARSCSTPLRIYTGTGIQKPDYLCTIDADPESATYSAGRSIGSRCPGSATSCTTWAGTPARPAMTTRSMSRRYLIVPGVRSSNLHIVDTLRPARAGAPQGRRRTTRSRRRPISPRPTRCTVSARRSSSRCSATRRVRRPAATCISTRTSTSSGAGKHRWGTSRSATTSGTSHATT